MSDITNVLRRRWLAATLAGVLVLGAVGLVFQRTPQTYTYTSTVLLLPPELSRVADPDSPDYTRSNPLFYLGSLTQTRDILVGVMNAKDNAEDVAARFPNVTYTASPDALGSGPVVVVTAVGTDETTAAQAIDALTDGVPEHLESIQKGLSIKPNARITAFTLTTQETPTTSHKDGIRAAVTVGGVLSLVFLFAIGVLDTLLMTRAGRSKRREDREGRDPEPDGRRVANGTGARRASSRATRSGAEHLAAEHPAPEHLAAEPPETASSETAAEGHAGLTR